MEQCSLNEQRRPGLLPCEVKIRGETKWKSCHRNKKRRRRAQPTRNGGEQLSDIWSLLDVVGRHSRGKYANPIFVLVALKSRVAQTTQINDGEDWPVQ